MQGKGNKNRHPVITFGYDANKVVVHQSLRKKRVVVQQLDFKAVKEEYPSEIVNNIKALEDNSEPILDTSKNVLVSLVKNDTIDIYLDRSAKVYKCSVELTLFLSRDSEKPKQVWLCSRCSLGWRVTLSGTALDASGAKVENIGQKTK